VVRLSQLIGQRVVDRDGQLVGSIHSVLIDTERSGITAALLQLPVGGHGILEWSAIVSVGRDAVTATAGAQTREPEGESEQRLLRGELDVFGKNVLTADGASLGELSDLELDEVSGRIVRLHLPDQVVPAGRFLTIGADVLIIAAASSSTAASAG
jgi:sporulation protein YlmC with PRC-barrel domain